MPRNNSSGYSRDDWRNMLCGSYVRITISGAETIGIVADVEGDGPFRLVYTAVSNSGRAGELRNLMFTDDDVGELLDINRPRARLVSLRNGVVMVRPLVRRTRRKGLHPEDYEVHFLHNNHRGPMSRTLTGADRNIVASVLLGSAQDATTVRGNGSLAIVSATGELAVSRLFGADYLGESQQSILAQLGARLGYGELNIPAGITLDESTLSALANTFGLVIPGVRLFWQESVIGRVSGRNIILDESADLLSTLVAQSYPEYEVQVNAASA